MQVQKSVRLPVLSVHSEPPTPGKNFKNNSVIISVTEAQFILPLTVPIPVNATGPTKYLAEGYPRAVKYYGVTQKDVECFMTRWLDYPDSYVTYESPDGFPKSYHAILQKAKDKGESEGVPWTTCAGSSERKVFHQRSCSLDGGKGRRGQDRCHDLLHLKIKYRAQKVNCVLFALLLVLKTGKRKAKLAKRALGRDMKVCGFPEVADRAAGVLHVSLKKIAGKDLEWLLQQVSGKFLLLNSNHVISVDCAKCCLYDCGKEYVQTLNRASLRSSGFRATVEQSEKSSESCGCPNS